MNYDRPGYLLYQTEHGRPLTVAYISRDDPRTLTERVPLLQHLRHLGPDIIEADLAAVGPTILADLGVGTVVLDRYKMPGGLERLYTEEVASADLWGVAPDYEDDRITVYQAPRRPSAFGELPAPGAVGELGAAAWEDGNRARAIGSAPAAVELDTAQAARCCASTIRVRKRSRCLTQKGESLATLPAAPQGGTSAVAFGAGSELLLRSEAGAVIRGLALE